MIMLRKYIGRYILFICLGLLTAVGSAGVLLIINEIVTGYIVKRALPMDRYVLYFAGTLALFFISRWVLAVSIINFMQEILRITKVNIARMVLRSSYHPLMNNKDRVYSALTRDTGNIVNASVGAVDLFTNIIIIVLCSVYMAVLSVKLLLFTFLLIGFTLFIYMISEKKAHTLLVKAMSYDDKFVWYLGEILSGFKEIIISRKKGVEILERQMTQPLNTGMKFQKQFLMQFLHNRIMGQLAFYIFIGIILFFLGNKLSIDQKTLVSFVFLLLYMWGPIETVVVLIPGFAQARTSWKRLQELSAELEEKGLEIYEEATFNEFQNLRLKNIYYEYKSETDEKPFSVGPANFHLQAGEVAFVYGGNGSGKTTFVNLLMGLFFYKEGETYVNDELFTGSPTLYRSLFTPVFSDFHLFDELYGIDQINEEKVREYLSVFELDKKVQFSGNKFSTINLSTGQKKRLALIYAMIEKKPILILDEFAAEQDPRFRKKFYTEILTYLKSEGFTIIAITHDNLYYEYCDRLYSMDYGRLTPVSTKREQLLSNEVQ